MKKSLLLSIVMTLVLVVAMSTATFAWYTANANVSASATQIQAGTSGSSLVITAADDAGRDTTKSSVALTLSTTIDPMVLASQVAEGAKFSEVTFKTATEDNAGKLVAVGDATAAVIEQVDSTAGSSFFLTNTGNAATGAITITINPVADGNTLNNRLCVAIFVGTGANAVLKGIYAVGACNVADSDFVVGTASADAVIASTLASNNNAIVVADSLEAFGANDSVEIQIKAWLDGDEMVNSMAGATAQFSLAIQAA